MRHKSAAGFTLIEIMVAVAVFSMMSLLAWATLSGSLTNADILSDRMDRLQAIQRTMHFLGSDIVQLNPRPVRDELGDTQMPALLSSLSGDFALELTHGGWSNPAGMPRSTLQRTAYRLEDGQLLRYHWNVLDRTFANEPVSIVLLEDVDSLVFRFFDAAGESSEVWPPPGSTGASGLRVRPRAVEIILTLPDEGELTRLLEVAP